MVSRRHSHLWPHSAGRPVPAVAVGGTVEDLPEDREQYHQLFHLYLLVHYEAKVVYPAESRVEKAWAPTPTPKPTATPKPTEVVINRKQEATSETATKAEEYTPPVVDDYTDEPVYVPTEPPTHAPTQPPVTITADDIKITYNNKN